MEKAELRKKMVSLLLSLPGKEEMSKRIVNKLLENKAYMDADTVLAFYPLKSEVNILPLLDDERVLLPFIEDGRMKFSRGKAEMSSLGVKLSSSKEEALYTKAVILVPLLAYDGKNYRLGRGGGYYDRYIRENKNRLHSIGLAYPSSFVERLEIDEWDERLDEIITTENPTA